MQSLPDRASVERAITTADDRLASLLAARLVVSTANDVTDLTHYLVVEPSDGEDAIVAAAGLSPLVNPIDRVRFPDPAFHPWWDWLVDLGGWFEMIIGVGDAGFAFVLLIEDSPGADPDLLHLCRTFAGAGSCS